VTLRKQMTHDLWKAGVKLMAGSDSPEWFLVQGFSIHDELETFVKCGLTPWAALQTATINPATYLSFDKRLGTIEQGKQANLILLDKNPLEDIRNTRSIHAVFTGKKMYEKQQLQEMMTDARSIGN
jgi:imidazolonepropionase-like amidohydrolase